MRCENQIGYTLKTGYKAYYFVCFEARYTENAVVLGFSNTFYYEHYN